ARIEIAVAHYRLKGRRDPFIQRIRRLNVVVPVAQYRRFAGSMQPVGVNQRVLRCRNDLYVFETGSLHAVGNELRGAPHVREMLGQGAGAGDAQEGLQLVEKTRLILFYE